jgi:hypothetical protein
MEHCTVVRGRRLPPKRRTPPPRDYDKRELLLLEGGMETPCTSDVNLIFLVTVPGLDRLDG